MGRHIRLQPLPPTVAAPATYGCSPSHIRLQAGGFSVAQPQPELPLLYFSAEFELLLGGGEAEGGEGIHVFFGPAGEISHPPAPPPLSSSPAPRPEP